MVICAVTTYVIFCPRIVCCGYYLAIAMMICTIGLFPFGKLPHCYFQFVNSHFVNVSLCHFLLCQHWGIDQIGIDKVSNWQCGKSTAKKSVFDIIFSAWSGDRVGVWVPLRWLPHTHWYAEAEVCNCIVFMVSSFAKYTEKHIAAHHNYVSTTNITQRAIKRTCQWGEDPGTFPVISQWTSAPRLLPLAINNVLFCTQ